MLGLDAMAGIVLTGIVGLVVWLAKRSQTRMDKFEERLRTAVTELEVRTIIDDKITPVRDELTRLDKKLDLLIQIALKQIPNDRTSTKNN